ncbi:hypothetical protein C0V72_09080 [Porphyrobacter sp. TH134]|uniref:hypothetical protein n=1 Tax=Porphyrobacter sp. TH134 TaxID=2067450 RepID=UPI000C7BB8F0|nr:hypothetical protein [Porphyrobacter sp. TH134]PLK23540.1 hypothetical protein C0V72_09080 [Porphyrobacter sp. TH134]
MVQLVCVHGVATRPGDDLTRAVENRDALFARIVFPGIEHRVWSPVWGDLVPRVDPGVFDTDRSAQSLSLGTGGDDPGAGLGSGEGNQSGPDLAAIAAQAPSVAVDAVMAELVDRADAEGRALDEGELSAFERAATAIASGDAGKLLENAASDDEIAFNLAVDSGSYGIGNTIGAAVAAVTGRARNAVSTVAFGAVRDSLSPAIAFFLGDVFAYLKDGGLRARIRARVLADIAAAHAARKSGEPLVLVGHSLGGVILVDMLCDPGGAGLPQDLAVDALFTVGSQAGLFQSVGVLESGVNPPAKVARPEKVARWFNVFDPIDPLAFRADASFTGVEDIMFDSITGLASAHTTYFKRPQFYARFGKRLRQAVVIA